MRRIWLALTVSLAVHLLVVGIAVGVGLWRALSLVPAFKVQSISIDVVKDLPLGAPPEQQAGTEDEPPARAPRPRHRVAASRDGVSVPGSPDAAVPEPRTDAAPSARPLDGGSGGGIDGGRRRPGDLRENGPEGSRLIALLRLDRLRASAGSENTIAAIDQLLQLLPDRRRLVEGTGLDLYRDFDSLLIATPNPTNDAVTFLAVRHHLTDTALKAGLDRGAKAARRPIEWQTIGSRPVGIRRQPAGTPREGLDRDDRILALPQTSLAIMATAAYAAQLLDIDPLARPSGGNSVDGGAPDAQAASGPPRKPGGRSRWQSIAARIEAEESALPDEAAFMMMATGLFAQTGGVTGYVSPPTRGASDDMPPQPVGGEIGPVPQVMTLLVGVESPFIELSAEFKSAAEADGWERDLPAWRRKVLTNPVVLLSGFASLIGRSESSREGNTLHLRAATSTEELQRLLNLIANLTRGALARPR
jgi:hypothetical protein